MEPTASGGKLQPAPSMPALLGPEQQGDLLALTATTHTAALNAPPPSAKSTHGQALDVCHKLDTLLSRIIPIRESENKTADRGSEEYMRRNLHEYIEAAKWLESYFVSVRSRTGISTKRSLEKEIKDLEAELQVKDEVISDCSEKLKDWSQRLHTLQDKCYASQNAI